MVQAAEKEYDKILEACQTCDQRIARDEVTFQKLLHPVWAYANETPDRIPLSDWPQTMTGKSVGFRACSLVGGFFIKVLQERLKSAV
jgi:hypothetical protein